MVLPEGEGGDEEEGDGDEGWDPGGGPADDVAGRECEEEEDEAEGDEGAADPVDCLFRRRYRFSVGRRRRWWRKRNNIVSCHRADGSQYSEDPEHPFPVEILAQQPSEDVANDSAERRPCCITRESVILRLTWRKRHAQDTDSGRHHSSGAETLQAAEDVEADLAGDKGEEDGCDGDPDGAPDEDEAFAVDVCKAAPEKLVILVRLAFRSCVASASYQETAKCEVVR